MNFKTILTAAVIGVVATTAIAQDKTQPVVIAAGMPDGGYDKFAKAMTTRLNQRGYANVTVSNNNGSDAITLAACNGKADVWIAQVDAIYTRYTEGCVLAPVADYGTEVAVLMVPPKSEIDELSDLTADDAVAVDGIGSGTELFWRTIASIESGDNGSGDAWAKATPVESSPELLNTMANFGDIQAAVLVRKPDNQQIQMLLNQGWTFAELWDKDINDQEFNNLPLYESAENRFNSQDGAVEAWTYNVRAFVGVSKQLASNRPFKMDIVSAVQ